MYAFEYYTVNKREQNYYELIRPVFKIIASQWSIKIKIKKKVLQIPDFLSFEKKNNFGILHILHIDPIIEYFKYFLNDF